MSTMAFRHAFPGQAKTWLAHLVSIIALLGELSVSGAAVVPMAETKFPEETGPPICVRVGTRSEGWAWPSGRFIRWAKCKGLVPKCEAPRAKHAVGGWYAGGILIVPAHCAAAANPEPGPNLPNFTISAVPGAPVSAVVFPPRRPPRYSP
jgi:hypothetical protein